MYKNPNGTERHREQVAVVMATRGRNVMYCLFANNVECIELIDHQQASGHARVCRLPIKALLLSGWVGSGPSSKYMVPLISLPEYFRLHIYESFSDFSVNYHFRGCNNEVLGTNLS